MHELAPSVATLHGLAEAALAARVELTTALSGRLAAAANQHPTDGLLHAAALLAMHATETSLVAGRDRGWAPGLAELVDRGHLAAAAYAAPRLVDALPHVQYLALMDLVFRTLPELPAIDRTPFRDDRTSDVQVVRVPGANIVVIAFCGGGHNLMLPLNIVDRWFAQLPAHLVYIRDRDRVGYLNGVRALGPDMRTTIDALGDRIEDLGATHVSCIGYSAGASGALRYAQALGAARVVALAPVTNGRRFAKKLYPGAANPERMLPWVDVVPLYRRNAHVDVRVVYGAANLSDRQQAERMRGLPGVTVETLPDCSSHHLARSLVQDGRILSLLAWLVEHGVHANHAPHRR